MKRFFSSRWKRRSAIAATFAGSLGLVVASGDWWSAKPAPEAPPLEETPPVFVFESKVLGALFQIHASIVRESYEQAYEYFKKDALAEARRVLGEAERLREEAAGEINNKHYRAYLRYAAAVKLCQRLREPGVVYEAARFRLAQTRGALQKRLQELRDLARDHKNNVRWEDSRRTLRMVRELLDNQGDEFAPENVEKWLLWCEDAHQAIIESETVHSTRWRPFEGLSRVR